MAGKTSKTARASVRAGQGNSGAAITVLGEMKFIIPLNNGRHAYVRNVQTGRTEHLRTDSEAFVEEIRSISSSGHGPKIEEELKQLAAVHPGHGWETTEQRLREAGVFV